MEPSPENSARHPEKKPDIIKSGLRSLFSGLLPLFVLAHFGHHLVAALLTPLLPFVRDEFALNYAQISWLLSAFTLAYGAGQLPAGWLADRLGPRILITVGVSGVALFGLLVGLSPTYVIMAIFLILLGLLGGGYHPAASPLVSASADDKYRGLALGLHQIGGTASFFLSPLIAVGIATALGWRGSFIALAIPTILFGIIFHLLLGRRGYAGKAGPEMSTSSDTPAPSTTLHLRRLVPFMVLAISVQVLIFSTVSFIPLFVVDHLGASVQAGGALFALFHFAGLIAGPVGGFLSDRLGKVPVILVVSFIGGPAVYLLSLVSFGWSVSAVLLIMGMAQYISMPVAEAYIISHTSPRNRSTVLGIYYFASRGGPGVVMLGMGYLIDRAGFGSTFTVVAAALMLVAIGCFAFLRGSQD